MFNKDMFWAQQSIEGGRKNPLVKCPVCQKQTTIRDGKPFFCNGCGYGKEAQPPKPPKPKEPPKAVRIRKVVCARCGKEIDALSLTRRYCDECKKIISVETRQKTIRKFKQKIRRCAFCGVDISERHGNMLYCSALCCERAKRKRNKEAKQCQV